MSSDTVERYYRAMVAAATTDSIKRMNKVTLLPRVQANVGCGPVTIRFFRNANGVTADSASNGVEPSDFFSTRRGPPCNQAAGMRDRATSESGIVGLPSANVAKADVYMFAGGELAPHDLKVVVVYLTPGTYFSGR